MRLPPSYFRPFDKVYRAVTEDIRSRAATLAGDDRTWLERLVVTFLEAVSYTHLTLPTTERV